MKTLLSGTARFAKTEKKKDKAFAEWVPDIPETGEYAVYVSYQTLPGSVSDAKYLVFHNGGVTEFKVNQQIGSGTWVYLGTFTFDKGRNDYGMVVLSNESKEKGVVCADAVRFEEAWATLPAEDKPAACPDTWKAHATLPNGQACPIPSMEAMRERMI